MKQTSEFFKTLLMALCLTGGMTVLLPSGAWGFAGSWRQGPAEWESKPRVSLNPFQSRGVGLTGTEDEQLIDAISEGTADFVAGSMRLMKLRLPLKSVAVRMQPDDPGGQKDNWQSGLMTFWLDHVPFCDYEVRAVLNRGIYSLNGSYPDPRPGSTGVEEEDWPDRDEAVSGFLRVLDWSGTEVRTLESSRCYGVREEQLLPLWKFIIKRQGRLFSLLVEGQDVVKFQGLFFEATARIKTYTTNPRDNLETTLTVDVDGSGYLTSSRFETSTNSHTRNESSGIPRAYSPENSFLYDAMSNQFGESSVFAHASQTYSYFADLGYVDDQTSPVMLVLHAVFDGEKNNALYEPPVQATGNQAVISVGDGDGAVLQHLPFDADVVSHEFAHHVVYKTLKEVAGESLILHEGLADYFTFARTGNACLGESICPEGTSLCVIPPVAGSDQQSCLRSGELDVHYNDSRYRKYGSHTKGQMISGYLWRLREKLGDDVVTPVAFKSLSYLVRDSGFRDFLIALLLADQDLNGAKNACTFHTAALEISLGSFLENVDCENQGSWEKPSYDPGTSSSAASADKDADSSSGGKSCGVLGTENRSSPVTLILLFFAPLIGNLLRRKMRRTDS